MDKELMLDVGQANELKLAFRRSGWTNADLKRLCEGDLLSRLLPVVRGHAEVTAITHVIDCDADPLIPYNGQIWKIIKLGTGLKSGGDFCAALESAGCRVNDWARDIMSQKSFTVATAEEDADLVVLSVADLGFKECARYDKICARGVEIGLELCPAEVGPQLRLQYLDQPFCEWLVIAMAAIRGSDGDPSVFLLGHDGGGLCFSGGFGDPCHFLFHAGDQFVFCARKSSPLG